MTDGVPCRRALALLAGAGVLVTEVGVVRLAAPVLGASQPVWAVAISAVLVALAIGSALGGRLAGTDRRRRVGIALVAGGATTAALPWGIGSTLGPLATWGPGPALAGMAAWAALPALPLGALPPLLVRDAAPRLEDVGPAAGAIGAWGTFGALIGALGATFALVPWLGSGRTFAVVGVALVAPGIWLWRPGIAAAVVLVLAWPAASPGAVETPYARWEIREDSDGVRWLLADDGRTVQSYFDPSGRLQVGSWPVMASAPLMVKGARRMFVVGVAGGTVGREARRAFPGLVVTGCEVDAAIVDLARKRLGLEGALAIEDGRVALRRQRDLDVIAVDAYRSAYVPPHLISREFVELAHARLRPGGALVVNLIRGRDDDGPLIAACAATARAVFRRAYVIDVGNGLNAILVATDRDLEGAALARAALALPTTLASHLPPILAGLRPAPRGGRVLTDDHAPVAWLTHRLALEHLGR